MTAFAACLFALTVFASIWIIAASWRCYGPRALALRAQLEACPETLTIRGKIIERAPAPLSFRTARAVRPDLQKLSQPGLDWPGMALAA